MDESTLLLEVGSGALDDLTTDEKTAILARYTNAQVKYAGMKTFEVLSKKFQPNYRMGRMYEDLSDKFEAYRKIYRSYVRNIGSGKLAVDPSTQTRYDIERYKWPKQTLSLTS